MNLPSKIQTKIFNRIDQIPSQEWTIVFPKVVENYNFFRALDDSGFPEFSFLYIMVYENNQPIGAAPCFLMNFPLDFAVEGPFKKVLGFFKKIAPSILNPRILICGMPMGQGRIGIAKNPSSVLQAIENALDQIAADQQAAIIAFKDFNSGYRDILDKYLNKSFFRIDSFPSTDMEVSFNDFESYLKSLSSVTRSGIKRKFKSLKDKDIHLEITNRLVDETLNEVYELYLKTYNKNEMSLEKLTPAFFKKMSEFMPNETKFFLWRIGPKLVGFAFCLASEDYFIDYYLGFDYSLSYDYHLYYVRFRDLMNWCIQHKMKIYEMGPTTYEPKRRLGFNFIVLFIYAKHCNKFFNPIFRNFCRLIQPSNFDPVFKELRSS